MTDTNASVTYPVSDPDTYATGGGRPPVIHKVMKRLLDLPVRPALCGFVIGPANEASGVAAITERAVRCEACLTISLEMDLARS